MKYIKLFEDITTLEVPNDLEINDSVKDIVIELKDEGYQVYSNVYFNENDEYTLYVGIFGNGIFPNNSIQDRLEMIIDYMKLEWNDINIRYDIEYIENGSDLGTDTIDNIYSTDFTVPSWRTIHKISLYITHHKKGLSKSPEKKNFITKLFSRFR